jgi:N6-L-threonylcarbamoyladenine synthase
MGVMRRCLYKRLKETYEKKGIQVKQTYGYKTKEVRVKHNLPKLHHIDARCISGNPEAKSNGELYLQKKIRRHTRQLHKFGIKKGGKKRNNVAPYLVHGFCVFDKVRFQNEEYFIVARRQTGYFTIRKIDGEKVNKGSVSYKKLTFLEKANGYITERRVVPKEVA